MADDNNIKSEDGFSLNWLSRILFETGLCRPSKDRGQGQGLGEKSQRRLIKVWSRRESLSIDTHKFLISIPVLVRSGYD